jgi:predicted Zn-dependent protease
MKNGTLLATTMVCLLGVAEPAVAGRWHHEPVRYRDQSGYPAAVATAVGWWNGVPGRVRLVAAGRRRADIVIRTQSLPRAGWDGEGFYPPDGRVLLNSDLVGGESPEEQAETIAHEIGHALGLPHSPLRCSLMSPDAAPGDPRCAFMSPAGAHSCGPQRSDARDLARLYRGGAVGNWPGTFCPDATPPA